MERIDAQGVRRLIFEHLEPFVEQRGQKFDWASVTDDWHLLERGLVSSVQALELMFRIEEALDVEIDYLGRDPGLYLTVGGLVEIVLEAADEG